MDSSVNSEIIKVPPVPYTDQRRPVQGTPPQILHYLGHVINQVCAGRGGLGITGTDAVFYLPLEPVDFDAAPMLKDVEEIWVGIDLGGFLSGGEE